MHLVNFYRVRWSVYCLFRAQQLLIWTLESHDQAVIGQVGRDIILWLCFVIMRDHGDEEPVTSPGGWHWPVTGQLSRGDILSWRHDDTMTAQYCGQHPQFSNSHIQCSLVTAGYWPWGEIHWILTWGVYSLSLCDQPRRRTLNDCVLSLAGVSSGPVTSLGSARSPGQVGGKPRPIRAQYSGHVTCPHQSEASIESWRVTIVERAVESGERHCIYKTVNSFSPPCLSHISSNNPIHAKKACALDSSVILSWYSSVFGQHSR